MKRVLAYRMASRSEPLIPPPIWKWDSKANAWAVKGHESIKGTWDRPVLPPHPNVARRALGLGKKSSTLVVLMAKEDWFRAEVVLALYAQSMGLTRWDDFNEPRPGFAYYGYPGPPVHYAAHEVERLTCCPQKAHRYIAESRELRNHVSYTLCLGHWHSMLKDAWSRGPISLPPENPLPEKGGDTVGDGSYTSYRVANQDVKRTRCHKMNLIPGTRTRVSCMKRPHAGPCPTPGPREEKLYPLGGLW